MSNEYWLEREKLKLKNNLADMKKVNERIIRHSEKVKADIEANIIKLFSKYSKDNNLTYAEASKLLTGEEYREWRKRLEEYAKESNSPNILLELNTLSTKSQISRLEEILSQVNKVLNEDFLYKNQEIGNLLKDGVRKNYLQTYYNIDSALGYIATSSNMVHISDEDIEDVIMRPWSGKSYSDRLWMNKIKLKDVLEEKLVQGLIQGKSLNKLSKEISETLEVSRSVASRLINTEHAYACAQGDLKAYNASEVEKYEYIATLDIKTSKVCRKLDKKVFEVSEAISGVNFPPMHPHCRSTTVPYIEGINSTRIARDKEGKSIYVSNDMSYEEWHKKYVESDKEYSVKEKKWENRHADKKRFAEYRKAGVEVPKSFEDFQNLKYNDSKTYGRVKNQYRSFNAIDKKDWSPEFKGKCKDTIKKFAKQHDLDFNDHSVARYHDRISSKDKKTYMSEADFVALAKSKPNYREPEGNLVVFKNKTAIIFDIEYNTHIKTVIVNRNKPRKGWEEL